MAETKEIGSSPKEEKKKGGGPAKPKHKMSSGKSRGRRLTRAMKRVQRKIGRFERYKLEGRKTARELRRGNPTQRWDTAGLESHIKELFDHKKRVG